jgi:hypothetical protein
MVQQVLLDGGIVGSKAESCMYGGMRLHRDDVVAHSCGDLGVVLDCILIGSNMLWLEIEILERVGQTTPITKLRQTGRTACWDARQVYHATAWCMHDACLIVMGVL